ncbi:DUF5615 family PIN-like protein [Shumkonia mesophila]|uniref:DUF5615 family PIN-like protein n=1 Tax=Shumkonia mesophila TaxID=2838854 RepID=UPI00293512A9|nr:DUF5615 family PIN-like protein [Shumkonia mesophila]
MKFLCDEMLQGLGRWLRAAGYDTAIAGDGAQDRDLLRQAAAEERIVVSRDRHLLEHRAAAGRVVLLAAEGTDGCARELAARLPVDWSYRPFSRCLLCNASLVPATAVDRAALPPAMAHLPEPLHRCPRCDKIYWEGGHVRRMRARLAGFAASGAGDVSAEAATGIKAIAKGSTASRKDRPPPSVS